MHRLWLVGLLPLLLPSSVVGWSFDVHHLVNRAATTHLPPDFIAFAQWVDELEALAIEADVRKCCVPGEGIKHYIDIDDYPEFFEGTLPHTYEAMVDRYGQTRVDGNGTVPWAIEDNQPQHVDPLRGCRSRICAPPGLQRPRSEGADPAGWDAPAGLTAGVLGWVG